MPDPSDISGERSLLCSVLVRAISDFVASKGEDRRTARRWLRAWKEIDFKRPFSFPWVCTELDLDPYALRNLLLNELEVTPVFQGTVSVAQIESIFNTSDSSIIVHES